MPVNIVIQGIKVPICMNVVVQHVIVKMLEKQIDVLAPVFKSIVVQIKKSPVYNHLFQRKHFNYVVNLHSLPPSNNSVEYLEHVIIFLYHNIKIIDSSQNWIELYFLENLYIKWKELKLNCCLKLPKNLFYFHDNH